MGENSENNSVNIYLRIRPSKISESTSPAKSYMDINSSSSSMVVIENKPYVFDNVFYSASTQEEIFQIIVSINNQKDSRIQNKSGKNFRSRALKNSLKDSIRALVLTANPAQEKHTPWA